MRAYMRLLVAFAATAFIAAVIAFCVPAQTAQAQGMGGRAHQQAGAPKSDSKAPKADDKAYKDALKSIPEKKVDPWGTMR